MPIQNLALRYNTLQKQMGAAQTMNWSSEINTLFSESFTKVINGSMLVMLRSDLNEQIAQLRAVVGTWTIEEKDIIPSLDNKKCTLR